MRAAGDFGGIEDSFSKAGEKTAGATFADVTARTEPRRAGRERVAEAEEVVFGPAGAVQQ
jgi:hypothetical protein